jgi:hypothetical protein
VDSVVWVVPVSFLVPELERWNCESNKVGTSEVGGEIHPNRPPCRDLLSTAYYFFGKDNLVPELERWNCESNKVGTSEVGGEIHPNRLPCRDLLSTAYYFFGKELTRIEITPDFVLGNEWTWLAEVVTVESTRVGARNCRKGFPSGVIHARVQSISVVYVSDSLSWSLRL